MDAFVSLIQSFSQRLQSSDKRLMCKDFGHSCICTGTGCAAELDERERSISEVYNVIFVSYIYLTGGSP